MKLSVIIWTLGGLLTFMLSCNLALIETPAPTPVATRLPTFTPAALPPTADLSPLPATIQPPINTPIEATPQSLRDPLPATPTTELATPAPPALIGPATNRPTPTISLSPTALACAELDAQWGYDWPAAIALLEELRATHQSCGQTPLAQTQYAAHFNYARQLEQGGQLEAAITHYQAALLLDPQRNEAVDELVRLQALPDPTPAPCPATVTPQPELPPTEPLDSAQLVTVRGNQLWFNEQPFLVRGVNYYPRQAPWHRFLKQATETDMAAELEVIHQAGFNTLRIFLRYEPLFICQPEVAIPNETAFAKVDTLFRLADERNLKLIVTLNDLPDLWFRPLYTDWAHYNAQTVYIVQRYRNQPHILAWDLRNEADLDYGVAPTHPARARRSEVLSWLAHISQLVRQHDSAHLLTAGWYGDPLETSPYVDILSFHHWTGAAALQARLRDYRQRTTKPLLLQEVGYSSWAAIGSGRQPELAQAEMLGQVMPLAERERIAGWLVWTAFDFEPRPGEPLNQEHFFGLWRRDLSPKPALGRLPLPQ